jgi:hypothetical protein
MALCGRERPPLTENPLVGLVADIEFVVFKGYFEPDFAANSLFVRVFCDWV